MHQAETLEKIMNGSNPDSHDATKTPRVISITSGKGGVGKTSIVINLAYCLARLGKRVLILDADLNLANVDILLALTPKYNLHHVFTGDKKLKDILMEGPGGIRILPASSGIMELGELSEEQKIFFLSEMDTLSQTTDIMLIDTGAGLNNNVIYFTLAAQERIVVLNPEPTSLTDAYAMIKVLATRHDVKKIRVLVNSCRSQKEALAVFRQLSLVADRFLDTVALDFLGHIPLDSSLPRAIRSQQLVTETTPDSPASKKINNLAQQITEEDPIIAPDGNIKFFWQSLFQMQGK